MVQNISSVNGNINTNSIYNNRKDIETLLKYTNNQPLKDVPDTFSSQLKSSVPFLGLFEGIPLFNFIRRNKKLGKAANSTLEILNKNNTAALTNIKTSKNKLSAILDFIDTSAESKKNFGKLKSAVKEQSSKNIDKITKKLDKACGKLNKTANSKTAQKVEILKNKLSSAQNAIETVNTAATAGTQAVGKVGRVSKFLKSSGAAGMMIFSGIAECLTEVIPTFKELGSKKGVKQIGKSAIKVVGDTTGFIVGEQLGTAAGTAVGTIAATKIAAAAGTAVCPVIGTAVGAICGFVGGLIGSWALGKVTKKITGATEREIAKQQQEQNNVNEISKNTEATEELKNQVLAKIEEEKALNNGKLSENSLIALQAIENLDNTNPFAETI